MAVICAGGATAKAAVKQRTPTRGVDAARPSPDVYAAKQWHKLHIFDPEQRHQFNEGARRLQLVGVTNAVTGDNSASPLIQLPWR